MYHIEMHYKGLVANRSLLTDVPVNILKSPHLYVQEFKIFTEKHNATVPDEKEKYYFDAYFSLFIEKEETMAKFLESIRAGTISAVKNNGAEIINSEYNVNRFGDADFDIPTKED
ncbi:MAG: hypothetical protein Q4B48_00405 [Syntrophomonadaceae bacterium]|nr:hypothetical protein [Syntrophomonadaceae bacterium]